MAARICERHIKTKFTQILDSIGATSDRLYYKIVYCVVVCTIRFKNLINFKCLINLYYNLCTYPVKKIKFKKPVSSGGSTH